MPRTLTLPRKCRRTCTQPSSCNACSTSTTSSARCGPTANCCTILSYGWVYTSTKHSRTYTGTFTPTAIRTACPRSPCAITVWLRHATSYHVATSNTSMARKPSRSSKRGWSESSREESCHHTSANKEDPNYYHFVDRGKPLQKPTFTFRFSSYFRRNAKALSYHWS